MRKEYVVIRIDAAPDAAPYVVVSLSSKKDMQEKDGPLSSPFGKANVMGFSNMNDMAKELNKMMTGGTDSQNASKTNIEDKDDRITIN